jgi:hypothetical protein
MPKFSQVEKILLKKFQQSNTFIYKSNEYSIIKSGKPSPSKGECKTDLYIRAHNIEKKESREFKVSIKLDTAEFIENKTSLERAQQILGPNATQIISEASKTINFKFDQANLIKRKADSSFTVLIGWKFEIFFDTSRRLSVQPNLTVTQKEEILSGKNNNADKKNAIVNGSRVINSGIADTFLEISSDLNLVSTMTIQEIVNKFESISSVVNRKNINFGFTALNYRSDKSKWDGNRPLAVWIEWSIKNGKLNGELVYDSPFKKSGDEIGNKIRKLLESTWV